MKTVFLLIDQAFFISLIVLIALLVVLTGVFIRIVIIDPIQDEVPYKHWHWAQILVCQILPGVLLAIIIGIMLAGNIGIVKCTYQWYHGEYQITEGALEELSVEEFRRSGSVEPSYSCSFRVGGVYFPSTNDYTEEEKEALSEASYARIYYLYDGDTPWPWRIDVRTTD